MESGINGTITVTAACIFATSTGSVCCRGLRCSP